MSILGSIFSKILGHRDASVAASASSSPTASASSGSLSGQPSGSVASAVTPTPPTASGPAPATPAASGAPTHAATADATSGGGTPGATVDVAALLNGLAAQSREKLDWQHSIVDMLKLLGLDSSLLARQGLAQELHYSGDMHDSATMNIWLHKQVMQKLADNGGKVPDALRT